MYLAEILLASNWEHVFIEIVPIMIMSNNVKPRYNCRLEISLEKVSAVRKSKPRKVIYSNGFFL